MKNYITIVTLFFCSALYTQAEKHITVIIPSYNNASCYNKNLDSVFSQNYHNYNIIYIDDASPDGTGNLVTSYIQHHPLRKKIKLIKNQYNRKALANIYKTVHMCNDNDLIVILDGDDWFAHNNALTFINNLFFNNDIWLAYGQYINVPEQLAKQQNIPVFGYAKPTPEHLIESGDYRNHPGWYWSGLRMFYAGLFKQIQFKDFILPYNPFKGKFFPTSYDGAIMYPMLEMCSTHFAHIPEILLHRNIDTPLNDFKVNRNLQRLCGKALRTFKPYSQLKEIPQKDNNATAELIIIPNGNNDMRTVLGKIKSNDFAQMHILHTPTRKNLPAYLAMKRSYQLKPITPQKNIMQHVRDICSKSTCSHILIADNSLTKFSVPTALKLLEQLPADMLLCDNEHIDRSVPIKNLPLEHLDDTIYGFCTEYYPIEELHHISGLYRKDFLQTCLDKAQNIHELKTLINDYLNAQNNVVLCTL
ncbi:MAG: glycosyltransferase family A protein [Candidatus Dependentiae bacterium]